MQQSPTAQYPQNSNQQQIQPQQYQQIVIQNYQQSPQVLVRMHLQQKDINHFHMQSILIDFHDFKYIASVTATEPTNTSTTSCAKCSGSSNTPITKYYISFSSTANANVVAAPTIS